MLIVQLTHRSTIRGNVRTPHGFAMPLEKLISTRYNIFLKFLSFFVTFYIKEIFSCRMY